MNGSGATQPAPAAQRERDLLQRIQTLEQRLAALEARVPPAAPAATPASPSPPPAAADRNATGDSRSLPGFAAGTTANLLLDGYYEYNFNRPAGRANLLRPYDPSSNSFTLNQAAIVLQRTPDPGQGRRLGLRVDLMFGQAPESLSGSAANEPRTSPYRNVFQAFGTYVFPLGKGLTMDFGKFASPIGVEGTFSKDQINYTRSFLFTALPFYHLGFRTSYPINDRITATWMLVNGANQAEDFNGFKSNHFMLSTTLSKSLSWTAGYYVGREGRHLSAQPGLSTDKILARPDGRTHIGDSYLTWNATSRLTFVGEGDYVVSRAYGSAAPVHLAGGAGYAKYQLGPQFALAGRFEYVSDRGGYLSGASQALKEATATATYQPMNGVQFRWEFRRDYSNQPFFPSQTPGVLKREQSTALLGLSWWFGGKEGAR